VRDAIQRLALGGSALRVPPHHRDAEPRGLCGEPQTGVAPDARGQSAVAGRNEASFRGDITYIRLNGGIRLPRHRARRVRTRQGYGTTSFQIIINIDLSCFVTGLPCYPFETVLFSRVAKSPLRY
jgi:hypothetical protein